LWSPKSFPPLTSGYSLSAKTFSFTSLFSPPHSLFHFRPTSPTFSPWMSFCDRLFVSFFEKVPPITSPPSVILLVSVSAFLAGQKGAVSFSPPAGSSPDPVTASLGFFVSSPSGPFPPSFFHLCRGVFAFSIDHFLFSFPRPFFLVFPLPFLPFFFFFPPFLCCPCLLLDPIPSPSYDPLRFVKRSRYNLLFGVFSGPFPLTSPAASLIDPSSLLSYSAPPFA